MKFTIGIDATNIRQAGALVHLNGLLSTADPIRHKFDYIIIWSSQTTLDSIEDRNWILKFTDDALEKNYIFRAIWQFKELGKLVKKEKCTLLFIPGGSFITRFRPVVTMCQNLLPFEWRELKRYRFSLLTIKWILLRLIQSYSFLHANGTIFLSKYARNSVLNLTETLPGKEVIIPHGLDQRFFNKPRKQKNISEYDYENPFRLIYVSSIEPYKHHKNVILAVRKLRDDGVPVIIDIYGSPGSSKAKKGLNKLISWHDPLSEFVKYHGHVEHKDVHERYKKADLAVFASSCETFGQILIEGMAAGAPTACSNMSAMPEILGDAGIYFDPLSSDSIFLALSTLIHSPELRSEKSHKSYELAKQFSWEKCTDETFSFLHSCFVSEDIKV